MCTGHWCVRACVVFDTRYGNTERIARSIDAGLMLAGIRSECFNSKDVSPVSLVEYDLICIGAPTEWLTASRPIKEFLRCMRDVDLAGRYGYAFDTKLDRPLSGSAAKHIEGELRDFGLRMVAPHESARVFLVDGKVGNAGLLRGEVRRFEQVGTQLGLQAKTTALARAAGRGSDAPGYSHEGGSNPYRSS